MNFDLEGYVQRHGGVPTKKCNEWMLTCPICGKEDKLVVNVAKRGWHCWVCEQYRVNWEGKRVPVQGAGGVVALVQWLEGCSKESAIALVAAGGPKGDPVDLFGLEGVLEAPKRLPEAVPIPPPEGWRPILGNIPYCERRGISAQDVIDFGLGYCDVGRYRNRLIFPVWESGKLLYYQARAMWDPRPGEKFVKALNPPSVPGAPGPADVLMNLDVARHFPRVAIVEGPIDCVHAGLDSVCTWGKKISDKQILRMVRAGVKAVDLMWDGPTEVEPKGAWPEMIAVAAKLAAIFDTRLVFLPHGDPGDYPRSDLNQFRAVARSAASISRLAML